MEEDKIIEVESPKRKRAKKVDPFIDTTNKIIEKKGMKPKDFDQKAIREARKALYDSFVKENIELLLD